MTTPMPHTHDRLAAQVDKLKRSTASLKQDLRACQVQVLRLTERVRKLEAQQPQPKKDKPEKRK